MLFFKQDSSISPYSRRIIEISKRRLEDTILTKGQSKSILINDCPFCGNYITCAGMVKDYLKQGQIRMPCLIRSTDTEMIWLSIREDDRRSVKIGDRFGKLVVIIPQKPDVHGNRRWLCKCECGRGKIVRGDNLLSGRTVSCGCQNGITFSGAHSYISEEERNSVPVESKVIPHLVVGALSSKRAIGNESKVGKSIDVPLSLDFDGESCRIEVTGVCDECGEKIRFDERGYKICDGCGVEAAPLPGLSALPSGLKISDINAQYAHLSPQDTFARPPDDDLKRFMLINMSDYIDHRGGEWGSVQQVVFDPINKCEPCICYNDLCSGKRDFPTPSVASGTDPDTNRDYLAEFKAWCDDLMSKSIRPS